MRRVAERLRGVEGPIAFVALAVALTWITAAWCEPDWDEEPASTRLLRASLAYAAVVGWQPLVALAIVRRWFGDDGELDHGLQPARGRFWRMSIAWPAALIAAAAGIEALGTHRLTGLGAGGDAWGDVPSVAVAFLAAVGVLWLQAISEELAWRGYLMTRLMRRLGAWPGLVLHGVLWGLWYAPIFLVGLAGETGGLGLAGFLVTCALLGVVFGWIRLASRSIYVSAASNATLTICGGLPLALAGNASPLAAIYHPAGWLPILASIALIASRASLRAVVEVPYRRLPEHVN